MNTLRILLADDHKLVRAGIYKLLEQLPGVQVVAQADDGLQVLEMVGQLQPDLVVLDIEMPRCNGLETARLLAQAHPQVKVLILSMYDNEEYLRHALAAGARGYLLKDAAPDELGQAIAALMAGRVYLSESLSRQLIGAFVADAAAPARNLAAVVRESDRLSPRQVEVLKLIAQGHSTKEIARVLQVSIKTVETHRTRLMQQLDIHDVASLVRFAVREGLVSTD